jgi:hypothetical protein
MRCFILQGLVLSPHHRGVTARFGAELGEPTGAHAAGGTIARMSTTASKESVKALLDGLSDIEVRELCIKALRQWHSRRPADDQFQMHGTLGVELVPLLAARKGLPAGDVNTLKETFIDATNEPWMGGIVEFLSWLTRAGLAWPLGAPVNGLPITLRLTRAGVRLLGLEEDHPLLPGFVERIGARCPGLPDGVLALLGDARTCHGPWAHATGHRPPGRCV